MDVSTFATIISTLIAASAVIFSYGQLYGKLTQRLDHLQATIDGEIKPELKHLSTRIDNLGKNLNARIDGTNSRIDETNNRIDETNNRIDETNNRIDESNTRIDMTNTRIDTLQNHLAAKFH